MKKDLVKNLPEKINTPSKRGQSRHRGIDTAPAADQEAEISLYPAGGDGQNSIRSTPATGHPS